MVSRQGFIGKVRFPVKISNAVFQLACGSAAPSVFFAGIFLRCGMGSCPGRQKSRDAFLSGMRMPHFFRQTGALIQFGVRSSKIGRLFFSLLTLGIRPSSQEPFCGGSVRAVSLHTPSWELSLLPPRAFEEMEPGFFHLFKKIFFFFFDRLLQSVFIIDSRK